MWDPAGKGGESGHSKGVEHNFKEWAKELRNLGDFPAIESLSAKVLTTTVNIISKNKAPGIDGWTNRELKDWPLGLLELLAKLYKVVEKVHRWPEVIQHSMVAMLTKGGSEDAADRRPIVLLSV
eukprot:11899591-Heterocapsa_arctica.AAC.1